MLLILAAALVPSAASAHASLVDSNPKNGQQLTEVPDAFTVTLNESVAGPTQIAVVTDKGEQVATEEAQINGRTVSTRVDDVDALPSGDYVMSYRLVSADGHVVSGTVDFGIDLPQRTAAPTPSPDGVGESETPPQGASAEDAASGGDLTATVVWVSILLVVFAMLLIGVRWRVRSDNGGKHPDP
ncbi:copper resistance protein CopC [Aeromicrobium sp. CTD01-1L150]|uniref:copper resistance CopC family protein n=1 Tax=Aeromicrobium sp. CTD01-1L150 TaxID=3341830 RepID=UPI0035C1E88D